MSCCRALAKGPCVRWLVCYASWRSHSCGYMSNVAKLPQERRVCLQPFEKYGIVLGVVGNKRTGISGVLRQRALIRGSLRSTVD